MSCDIREDCACRDPDAQENNKGVRHRSIGWALYPLWHPGGLLGNHSSLHAAYKRAFPLTRTPTCPCFLIKQQLKRVWHSKTNNQPNTSTTGFAKDMKWKFYEWLMAIATIDVVKLRLKQAWTDSFVVLCLLSLIIIHKAQPWQCCFHVEPEEKRGKGKNAAVNVWLLSEWDDKLSQIKTTKLKWIDEREDRWCFHDSPSCLTSKTVSMTV